MKIACFKELLTE